jgi:hypothetical protein
VPGVENLDVSETVSGHLRYQFLIGRILGLVGLQSVDAEEQHSLCRLVTLNPSTTLVLDPFLLLLFVLHGQCGLFTSHLLGIYTLQADKLGLRVTSRHSECWTTAMEPKRKQFMPKLNRRHRILNHQGINI